MRALPLFLALCASAASAALVSIARHGGGLALFRVFHNGTSAPLGAPFASAPLAPTQGLSAIDSGARVLYTILANESARNRPALYGVSLVTGAVVSITALPIVNGDSIGAGQALGLIRATGDVVVVGTDAAGNTSFYLATPASGAVRPIATLDASLGLAPSCSHVAHDPASNALFFGGYANDAEYTRLALRMEVSTGAVERIANPEGRRISGYSFDAVSGNVVGLGSHGPNDDMIIAQLSTTNLSVSSLGAVPEFAYSASGLEALDAAGGTLTWVGGNDTTTPFFLVVNELSAGVPVASAAEVCKTFDSCALLTLDFDDAQ